MLFVAAMLAGLIALQLILSPGAAAMQIAASGASVLVALVFAQRLGCADREGAAPITHGFPLIGLSVSRGLGNFGASIKVARAAFAPRGAINPALVRVRTRPMSALAHATYAQQIGAAPGALVVETDGEGALLHVLDEDSFDMGALGALEAHAAQAIDGRPA